MISFDFTSDLLAADERGTEEDERVDAGVERVVGHGDRKAVSPGDRGE